MYTLKDNFNRHFSYLRLSLTNLCNFQCKYCMPENFKLKKHDNLNIDEIKNLIKGFTELGMNKIRLTGGEPTIRKDFVEIINLISTFKSIKSIVFTTNGHNLLDLRNKIKASGVTGINISLDTLNKNKFSIITNKNYFNKVYEGILNVMNENLEIKINVVLSKFFTFDDFENFYSLIKYKNIKIRFINQMETNLIEKKENLLNLNYLLKFLKKNKWKIKTEKNISSGPALTFENKNFIGNIGIINPYSNSFCLSCNRLRVTSNGEFFLCLFGGKGYNIRPFLDSPKKKFLLQKFLIKKIKTKTYSHFLEYKNFGALNTFSAIGG